MSDGASEHQHESHPGHGGHGHGGHGGHGHHGGASIDFAAEAERLRKRADARAPVDRALMLRLSERDDRVFVDVGCGAGGMAMAFAQTHPDARTVAVDAEQALVDLAGERAAAAGLSIVTAVADVDRPEHLADIVGAPADLVWAGGVIHHTTDQQAALDTLAGLLGPGGRLAIAEGGLPGQFLPWDVGVGRPSLELRLAEAGSQRMAAEHAENGAARRPYGWNVALEKAGLHDVRVINDVTDIPAPLTGPDLEPALHSLAAQVGWFEQFLDAEDRDAWAALLDADGPDWLGSRRDLYHLEIRSYYVGTKANG
ncbi:class I SAM-dependent methyltransferase [Glycomyces buryatensis]|uniref:Class I SAM-dependent methyltransferase n=1 Tax=Glycomyces buryatensis TaxID=2570927 RepID=A0A4S8QJ95_9ACTN|nr:class I SAM-dependent methyltransferase [Glycomyces buryatensis]THV41439.1 class I SAM-dependent methyltransferase [Glycomyces buryatensis]